MKGNIHFFILAFAKCCREQPDKFTPEVCAIFLEALVDSKVV